MRHALRGSILALVVTVACRDTPVATPTHSTVTPEAVDAGAGIVLAEDTDMTGPEEPTHVRMRNVFFRVDPDLIVHIRHLDGRLVRTHADRVPIFDDPSSFRLHIDRGELAIGVESLSRLLNRYTFADAAAPLRNLQLRAAGKLLEQTGTMTRPVPAPFRVLGVLSATDDGDIRLHPVELQAGEVRPGNLMDMLGLELADVININRKRGVWLEDNDIIMDPERLLPPPVIRGRVSDVRVEGTLVVQSFGPPNGPSGNDDTGRNFMRYTGGAVQFGKLVMVDADLVILDQDEDDPLDFFLERYERQLAAGYSKMTLERGLRVHMPDYADLEARN